MATMTIPAGPTSSLRAVAAPSSPMSLIVILFLFVGAVLSCSGDGSGGGDPEDADIFDLAPETLELVAVEGEVGSAELSDVLSDELSSEETDAEPLEEVADGQDVPEAMEIPPETAGVIYCEDDAPCVAQLGHPSDECGKAWCIAASGVCAFEHSADITPCEEPADACHSWPVCVAGTCRADLSRPLRCDDYNPCTDDRCDVATGACAFEENANFCDDHDPLTSQDRCRHGRCIGNLNSPLVCAVDIDCLELDNGDPCSGQIGCVEGACRPIPGSRPACERWPAPPCRRYVCDPAAGSCVLEPLADGGACDDSNPCTIDESCFAGDCFGLNLCDCEADADCAPYDDEDACNGVIACLAGECRVDADSVVGCGDPQGSPCEVRGCDPASGLCVSVPAFDGAPCMDLDACTRGELCAEGACVMGAGGVSVGCDDHNPCTADFCEPSLGCLHQNLDIVCDDGNPCTEGEYCQAGMCITASLEICRDDNPCTDDVCQADGGCLFIPNEQPCTDDNPCSGADTCHDGACVSGADVCGACEDDTFCDVFDDDDLCNGLLRCLDGVCAIDPATIVVCASDGDSSCAANTCDAETAQCRMMPIQEGRACDDADPCTGDDSCQLGACVGVPMDCDDGEFCTDDHCVVTDDGGDCVHAPNALACDDGDPCTEGDHCGAGACQPGGEQICGAACSDDAACAALDDGDPCNGLVRCMGGLCAFDPTTVVHCPGEGDSACRKNRCDPGTGACAIQALDDGTICNDEDVCTAPDTCTSGFCSGPAVDCDDGNHCTSDSCSIFYGCVHFLNEKECSDGNACTDGDRCHEGLCVPGTGVDCDDQNVCTADACDPGIGCVHEETWMDWCADEHACTEDTCDAVLGCQYEIICPEYCTNGKDDDLDGKTDCDDPDCQLETVCLGLGQCFAAASISCESSYQGDLEGDEADNLMSAYACTQVAYPSPEISLSFVAPCDGKVTAVLTETVEGATPLLDLFLIPDVDGTCAAQNCPGNGLALMVNMGGTGTAQLLYNATANQQYTYVVDGRNGDVGTFSLLVSCECSN